MNIRKIEIIEYSKKEYLLLKNNLNNNKLSFDKKKNNDSFSDILKKELIKLDDVRKKD